MSEPLTFDAELLGRHDRPGPRYTSYPTAPQFQAGFDAIQYQQFASLSNAQRPPRPVSFYVHFPYCLNPCFYCGCTRIISRDPEKFAEYATRVLREIELVAAHFDRGREVIQLHFGGGTPNLLGSAALAQIIACVGRHLTLSGSAARDFSIELDPRSANSALIPALKALGFNRVSVGVQDFDPAVQRAVNRIQDVDETLQLIDACRANGFRSVNVDLIYGLPAQTPAGFLRTLRTVLRARPDRLAVYGYAHLPARFKGQRQIDSRALPDAAARLELLGLAIEELGDAGYRYIGMDHFALPDDDLSRAQASGSLQRNFMGYTTHANSELVAVGLSAISHVGNSFSQNHREMKAWAAAVDAGRLPIARGLALSDDDLVRAAVIAELMCRGEVEFAAIDRRFDIDFAGYFEDALRALRAYADERLVEIGSERLVVTSRGRLLLRSIAMCFDAYLSAPQVASAPAYSRAV